MLVSQRGQAAVVVVGAVGISVVAEEDSMVVDSAVAGSTAEGSAAATLEDSLAAISAGFDRRQRFKVAVFGQPQVSPEVARVWPADITPDPAAHRNSIMSLLPGLLRVWIAPEP